MDSWSLSGNPAKFSSSAEILLIFFSLPREIFLTSLVLSLPWSGQSGDICPFLLRIFQVASFFQSFILSDCLFSDGLLGLDSPDPCGAIVLLKLIVLISQRNILTKVGIILTLSGFLWIEIIIWILSFRSFCLCVYELLAKFKIF